jgi:predicted flap endonuclease-1-like 5' DNA nuclease
MTGTQEDLMQKKSDLKFYYKMAQEAFQANDVDEALKISKSGLEQAKIQNEGGWINKFNSFNTNVSQLHTLTPSIKKETLMLVSGIGQKVAERLHKNGIHTIEELAHSTPTRLAEIEEIGLSTAQKYIAGAKERLRLKKLTGFSEVSKSIKASEKLEPDRKKEVKWFEKKLDKPETEKLYKPKKKIDNIQQNSINNIEENEFFEGDDEYDSDFKSQELPVEKEVEISPPEQPVVISPEIIQSNFELVEHVKSSKETSSHSQIKQLITKITRDLELSDFIMIQENSELRTIFTGIDLLAVRFVRVKEFLELLLIVPIKICPLKGTLIVSIDDLKYHPIENSAESSYHLDKIPRSYQKALSQSDYIITEDILNEGSLFRYFSKFLKINIFLEKTVIHKNLFFRSGPVQYKVFIEPVLLCQNNVGFTEKLIPFAYQKYSNIHIVEHSKFADLLHYLDQKYFLIETYSVQRNILALNCEISNQFMEDLRKYSVPFMIYGFIFLFTLLFQGYSTLPLLINLGYGIISFYIVLIAYCYLKLYKQRSELHREFSTPYYQRELSFDETNLILINEELNPQFMQQFVYECVGNDPDYNILQKIEQNNAENFFLKKLNKKKLEDSHLFEPENPVNSKNSTTSQDSNHKLVKKYSSFLED